jgi:hypothetical protein
MSLRDDELVSSKTQLLPIMSPSMIIDPSRSDITIDLLMNQS